jgi:hypothetical protein
MDHHGQERKNKNDDSKDYPELAELSIEEG